MALLTRSICSTPSGCHNGCGVILHSNDDRTMLLGVEGDRDNPFSMGRLCPRGLAIRHTVYHPDRLLHPLRRRGGKGAGGTPDWEEIGWGEALDLAADGLEAIRRESGPESVIFCKGTGRDIGPYLSRLAYGFGSPNYFALGPGSGSACLMPRMAATFSMMGEYFVPDCSQYFPERYAHPE